MVNIPNNTDQRLAVMPTKRITICYEHNKYSQFTIAELNNKLNTKGKICIDFQLNTHAIIVHGTTKEPLTPINDIINTINTRRD